MNEGNQNNLNNNVQGNNGQQPNGPMPNGQMPNPYAQSYNPNMQNMNANPYQNAQMNPNMGGQFNNQYNPNMQGPNQNNVNQMNNKQGPVKKHGMNIITTLILLVLIAVVVLGGRQMYIKIKNPSNTVKTSSGSGSNIGESGKSNAENIKIGAYIKYTPDTAEPYVVKAQYTGQDGVATISQNPSMYWKVFKVEDDYIEIIATVPTKESLTLCGAIGYDNGVYLLNDICKNLFSNQSLNAVGRSITIEDITSKIPEDELKIHNYEAVDIKKTYTGANAYCPDLYNFEKGSGVGKAIQYIEHSTLKENATKDGTNDTNNLDIELEEIADVLENGCDQSDSYYSSPLVESESARGYKISPDQQFIATHTAFTSNVTTCFTDKEYGPMFYGTQNKYWLASRFVNCATNEVANFGIRTVNTNYLEVVKMFDSDASKFTASYSILPIVTIKNYNIKSGLGTVKDPLVLEN